MKANCSPESVKTVRSALIYNNKYRCNNKIFLTAMFKFRWFHVETDFQVKKTAFQNSDIF